LRIPPETTSAHGHDVVEGIAKVVGQIEPHDPDLARQMPRAVTSGALNTTE